MVPVEVSLPDWPYGSLNTILFAEAAALRGAHPDPRRGPLLFPAVDFVQADRLRRMVAGEMARLFDTVDLLMVPSLRDEMLTISNHTGHPSLTLRAGFVEVGQARSDWAPDPNHPMPTFNPKRRVPHGITLIGRLFDEGLLGRVGIALESAFAVAIDRPPGF
jgi:Asp-tRNA(Asn)/Glu-tRNA(Gln) amidotransferase A subunit family amidase